MPHRHSSKKVLSTNGALSEFQTYPTQFERTELKHQASELVMFPRTCIECVFFDVHLEETHTLRETKVRPEPPMECVRMHAEVK